MAEMNSSEYMPAEEKWTTALAASPKEMLDESRDWESDYYVLKKSHDQLKGELMSCQLDIEELQMKYEKEEREKLNLQLKIALSGEEVDGVLKPTVAELERKITALENENHFLETTNKTLMTTLNDTRTQLGNIFRECNKKTKEACDLHKELEKLEVLKKEIEAERVGMDTDANLYAFNMREMLEEMNDQACKWETEKTALTARFEELEEKLRKENECLKAQKEDILNHTRVAEKIYSDRIQEVNAQLHRISEGNKNGDVKYESNAIDDLNSRIDELAKKLNDSMEAIEDLEEENAHLREKIEHVNEKNRRLVEGVEFHHKLYIEEQNTNKEDCRKFEVQIANLNEEMARVEEMRDQYRRELSLATEMQTQQTIMYANDKAKFCHDLERVEEKWHAECVKLAEQIEGFRILAITSEKAASKMTEEYEAETAKLSSQIKELKEKYETYRKESEEEELQLKQKTTLNDWDDECAGLEDEIYDLIDKRRTEAKRVKTIKRKNEWLSKSIKRFADQRREEIEATELEIRTLKDRCELLRKEKVDWLTDLKREVNEWKNDGEEKAELKNKVDELQKLNKSLEEKLENVTEGWRRECEVYQDNMTSLLEQRSNEQEERESVEARLYNIIREVSQEKKNLERRLSSAAKQYAITGNEMMEATEAFKKMMDEQHAASKRTQESIFEERTEIIRILEKKVEGLIKVSEAEFRRRMDAEATIKDLECLLKNQKIQNDVQLLQFKGKVEDLKEANEELKENMGVEALDDVQSDSSDDDDDDSVSSGSRSEEEDDDDDEVTSNASRTSWDDFEKIDEEGDNLYEDMPKLADERGIEERKAEQKKNL
ncbi:unnamed protein product [Caenorhabditis sp. 36 PRJEB53466]|nr:unnamed protein product [Caenorhabditis sp. 36 PRJEB53466]